MEIWSKQSKQESQSTLLYLREEWGEWVGLHHFPSPSLSERELLAVRMFCGGRGQDAWGSACTVWWSEVEELRGYGTKTTLVD